MVLGIGQEHKRFQTWNPHPTNFNCETGASDHKVQYNKGLPVMEALNEEPAPTPHIPEEMCVCRESIQGSLFPTASCLLFYFHP